MFEKKLIGNYNLSELLYENYTDFDILREKPMVFNAEKVKIVIAPVKVKDSPLFLKKMSRLILKYYEIFANLEFLSAYNFRDTNVVKDLVTKVTIFTASKKYKMFIKDAINFIYEWGFTVKGKGEKIIRIKSRSKNILNVFRADEIIYMLFIMFVYNYELEKKNCITFLKMFNLHEQKKKSLAHTDISKTQKKPVVIPKYSEKPFSKEILKILESQSALQ